MNRNFAKLNDGRISYAPNAVIVGGARITNPSAADYLSAGYKPAVVSRPTEEAGEGMHWERDGWEERETEIVAAWKAVENPAPAPRVFSKLKCYAALKELGYWEQVKAWLEAADLWDAFVLADEVSEDHPQFVQGLAKMKEVLGLSDEQVEAILGKVVAE